jgi:hypothetical protein
MNSLPPELLSSIIELAAKCTSFYDSYKDRIRTLSALALVNRTFYQFAQPLLPQKVYLKKEDFSEGLEGMEVSAMLESFMKTGLAHKTISLAFENLFRSYAHCIPLLDKFLNLKEMRLEDCRDISFKTLQIHRRASYANHS